MWQARPSKRTEINCRIVKTFLHRLDACKSEYPLHRIYNFDETCWKVIQHPKLIIGEKGTESVKLTSTMNDKVSLTAFGAISAAGEKLPLWVIVKGKTDRVHEKIVKGKTDPDVHVHQTHSGWNTSAMMVKYRE